MNLKVKFIRPEAHMPTKANQGDACFDLYAAHVTNTMFKQVVHFGIATEISKGYFADIRARSSVHNRFMWLANGCGVIDAGYRGEWKAVFYRIPFLSRPYKFGQRAAQFMLMPVQSMQIEQVTELETSVRGTGGFGSSGK